jgi:hypothetical protein
MPERLNLSQRDPALVGLCGAAGSGKSTAAWFLQSSYSFSSFAFADALRDMLCAHLTELGLDHAWITEPRLKAQPILGLPGGASGRQLMQSLGDWGRAMHPDYWVQCLQLACGVGTTPVHDRLLISDVRYPNEADWVLRQGGVLIRLVRECAAPVRSHSSEQHIADLPAHIVLVNNGPTHEGLHGLLRGAMADLGLEPRPDTLGGF